jgi:hypothetical protein
MRDRLFLQSIRGANYVEAVTLCVRNSGKFTELCVVKERLKIMSMLTKYKFFI